MSTLLQEIVALLAISNPAGSRAGILALTQGTTPAERTRGLRAATAATVIPAVAALAGRPVLAALRNLDDGASSRRWPRHLSSDRGN